MTQQSFHSNDEGEAGQGSPLAKAYAQARATLPWVQERFLQGMPQGSELHVKYAIDHEEDGCEYVWMLVQSWEEQRLSGSLLHDLAFAETPGAGDAVELVQRDVYDWSIYHADGSQEGGFTDAALGLPSLPDEAPAP